MRFIVAWGRDHTAPAGQPQVVVTTPDELDEVLDGLAASHVSQVVDIYPVDHDPDDLLPPVLQISISDSDRSFATYLGEPAGWAQDPELRVTSETITFDYGGTATEYGPERLLISSERARQLARHYVDTGQQPVCVVWTANLSPS